MIFMKENAKCYEENVPGKYYVLKTCIGCDLCAEIAPGNFKENRDEELAVGNCFVHKQPEHEAEAVLCEEAMDACPADAIQNNENKLLA